MNKLSKFKVALCQIRTCSDKAQNLRAACSQVEEAAKGGADLIVLPEMFTTPFTKEYMLKFQEPVGEDWQKDERAETAQMLSKLAAQHQKYIIGGTIPESIPNDERIYNTALCFDRSGQLVLKQRKLHLFDIEIPGKVKSFESGHVKQGPPQLGIFETEWCRIGLGVCFDIRFPEYSIALQQAGAQVLCFPADFAMRTGELHWDIITKGRAVDNQSFVIACACAPNTPEPQLFQAWGHSRVVSPWGQVLVDAEQEETVVYADIDLTLVKDMREQIPVVGVKRKDLYEVVTKDGK